RLPRALPSDPVSYHRPLSSINNHEAMCSIRWRPPCPSKHLDRLTGPSTSRQSDGRAYTLLVSACQKPRLHVTNTSFLKLCDPHYYILWYRLHFRESLNYI